MAIGAIGIFVPHISSTPFLGFHICRMTLWFSRRFFSFRKDRIASEQTSVLFSFFTFTAISKLLIFNFFSVWIGVYNSSVVSLYAVVGDGSCS